MFRGRAGSLHILLLCCLALLAGCGEDRLQKLEPDATILAFGDSLTFGTGVGAEDSYPVVLAELTQREVIRAGIPGETTADGLARLPDVLAEYQPDLMILLEGGNDILRNQTANTHANLSAMIELAQSQGVTVVLVAVPEKKLLSSAAPWYAPLAQAHDVVLEDEVIGELMRSPQYKSDSVHFNAQGYRVLAERIRDLLQENGAL